MSPAVVDKVAKKQEIQKAALSVFAQKGVKNTKIADIATAAGIGKGTIYEYFRSKDAVLVGAFEYFFELLSSESEARVEPLQDPDEKLRIFIQSSFDAAAKHADLMKLMFDVWAESLREGTEFNIKGMYEHYRSVIAHILQEGINQKEFRAIDPHLTAATLIAAMDGLMLQWVLDASLFDLKKMGHTLIDTFLQGIRAT